jgi:succinate-semialdehyde dehydrogenase/glutarate-semialdehyde dehydrogenase
MGGMRDSGVGRRHGREGIVKYCESQTVAVQRVLSIGPVPGFSLERYAQTMTLAAKVLQRIPGVK